MIDILMATYNGGKYIQEQIDSILNQTYTEWQLYIRDDGSMDETCSILECNAQRYPESIHIIKDEDKNLGVQANFDRLLANSSSEYCAFCDQDDVWIPTHLEREIEAMQETEREYPNMPIVIHSDLCVVDAQLNMLHKSFWKLRYIDPKRCQLPHLILRNIVTGNTMLMNRKLIEEVGHIPSDCMMHDYWIALYAGTFGIVKAIPDSLVLYRQHANNVLGAKRNNRTIPEMIKRWRKNMRAYLHQMQLFQECYGEKFTQEQYMLVQQFLQFPQMTTRQRLKLYRTYNILGNSKLHQLEFKLCTILFYPKQEK